MKPSHEQTHVEKATQDVLDELNNAITRAHRKRGAQIPEQELRRILAGYFERQTLREWAELLQIDPEQFHQ